MEAALASGVLKAASGKLVSLIASEFASITGVTKDLSDLQGIHGEITSWLAAVRDRSTRSDPQFHWVTRLKDVAYDIDDLLYEVQLEAEKHRIHRDSERHGIVLSGKSKVSFGFRYKVARKIKAIKVAFAAIVKQRSDANAIRNSVPVYHSVGSRNRTIGELSILGNVVESKIPKRDREKGKIIGKILESDEGDDGQTIISIVGFGGSGKTTLAKHICLDNKIKEHFGNKVFWVHVSQEFVVEKLIDKLFEATVGSKSDLNSRQHMLREISKELSNKKFLFVLDDAWHQDKHDWEQFMVHIKSDTPGSKILLTTRDQKVAELVKSRHTLELESLTEAESWSLFLKSSGLVEDDLSSEYIQVGKEILNRCCGVPLAIKTLGGILCENMQISIWKDMRLSNVWSADGTEDKVFASLKLSFIHLADELKQCITFCSIFPKGYEIYKDGLVAQWVAHGFINSMNGVRPEDIGSGYFDSLVKIGFLQDPYEDWYIGHLICKMHDLIHDLTRHILSDEVRTSVPNSSQRCRYLSLTSSSEKVDRVSFNKVHALFVSEGNPTFDKPDKKSSCMCSVVLNYKSSTAFPRSVLKFQYLGYLEIHNISCTKLSEAISSCWNLQSLHFIRCEGFVTLPQSIGKLKKLRTLELNYVADLEFLPQSIGECRDLQTLILHFCTKVQDIPSTICKIRNLRDLHIYKSWSLQQLPSELTGEYSNLQKINLASCYRFQELPSTLSCPTLCTLDLSWTKVTKLPPWVSRTTTLKNINLQSCSELMELPEDIGKLKWLEVLNIVGCSKLGCMPSGIGQLTRLRQLGLFIVGCGGDEARTSELENLDMLSGQMRIVNLRYVKDPCEAEKACLKHKINIQALIVEWQSLSGTEEELAPDVEKEQGVLNALEPPSQIEHLEIIGYRGLCLPRWMVRQNDSSYSESTLSKQTSPCQFLYLSELTLTALPSLKHMRGLSVFPSLRQLRLSRMGNLEELWTTTNGFEIGEEASKSESCFPALYKLSIRDCPKLSSVKPYFPPSLEEMYLSGYDSLQLLCPSKFSHSLRSPEVCSSSCNMHSVVPRLKSLILERMSGASSGWEFLQHHTELETLEIRNCKDLTQLPESIQCLTSLSRLLISRCHTPGGLPEWLGALRSLKVLHVFSTPEIIGLPESMKHLTALEELILHDCAALTVLPEWIGQLSALRRLDIYGCPGLHCLPQSIQGLTSLKSLSISSCGPDLATRCEEGVGPDWHLVSHIDQVYIRD